MTLKSSDKTKRSVRARQQARPTSCVDESLASRNAPVRKADGTSQKMRYQFFVLEVRFIILQFCSAHMQRQG